MIETDLHLLRDGAVALYHDDEIGGAPVGSLTLAELRERLPRAPTLQETLDRFGARIAWNLEIKSPPTGDYAGLEQIVLDEVRRSGILERTLFSSFSDSVLARLRDARAARAARYARLGAAARRHPRRVPRASARRPCTCTSCSRREEQVRDGARGRLPRERLHRRRSRGAAPARATTASTGSSRTCPRSCAPTCAASAPARSSRSICSAACAALGDRPDHERLAAAHVARGVDPGHASIGVAARRRRCRAR